MHKKNVNFILLSSLLLVVLSSFVYGAEVQETKIKELNLFQVIDFTIKQSPDLQMAKINKDNGLLEYEKNKANNLLTESRYLELQGKLKWIQAQDEYRQQEYEIINDVVNTYLDLVVTKKDLKLLERETELEKSILDTIRVQLETGLKGQLDLMKQQYEYNDAVINLEKAREDYQKLTLALKIKLGLKQESEIKIKDIGIPEFWTMTESEAIKTAVTNSYTLEQKQRQLELAEVDLERAQTAKSSELELKELKNNLKFTQINLEKTRDFVDYSARNQYYLFQQAVKRIGLSQDNLKKIQENYQIIKAQKEAGLKTDNDILEAEVQLLQAEYSLQQAINNYYLNELQLKQTMGLEIRG